MFLSLQCASKTVLHPTHAYIMIKVTVPFPKKKDLAGTYHMYRIASEISKEMQSIFIFFSVLSLHVKRHKYEQRPPETPEDLATLWLETTSLQVVVAFWLCLPPITAVFISSLITCWPCLRS